MSRMFGFIGLLIAMAVAAYLYSKQIQSVSPGNAAHNPVVTIDTVGVKTDLLALAQAERQHYAAEGKYVPLEQLQSNGDVNLSRMGRGPYVYEAQTTDTSFRITATYHGRDNPGVPLAFTVDEGMEVRQQ